MQTEKYRYLKAQTMLEYLLVMVVVVVIVFMAFGKNGTNLIGVTRDQSSAYFDSGAMAIMGGYWNSTTNKYVQTEPAPINGVWCGYGMCVGGYKVRECACPRPAFGGTPCSGEAVLSCS